MSQNIINEVTFFLHSFMMGIVITFMYDGFLILRRLIKHSDILVSLEDMVFWIACAIGVFYMLYEENNGILRWFAVFGAALGMNVNKKSLSALVIRSVSMLIERTFHILFRILRLFLYPFRFLLRKITGFLRFFLRKGKKVGKCAKNKLTPKMKLLKMVICRH